MFVDNLSDHTADVTRARHRNAVLPTTKSCHRLSLVVNHAEGGLKEERYEHALNRRRSVNQGTPLAANWYSSHRGDYHPLQLRLATQYIADS